MGWLTRRLGSLSSLLSSSPEDDDSWRSSEGQDHEMHSTAGLPLHNLNGGPSETPLHTGDTRRPSADKIRALDGLRGIACLIVYNYHFLWPWVPSILLGYGARPPLTEPGSNASWFQLPIVCLLHRGRPMVAIFFAISGYVVCRHILRVIVDAHASKDRHHQHNASSGGSSSSSPGIDKAYNLLATATFRRVFRLYIPATLSMLIVAVLAQTGLVFKSEFDVYRGPDSVYINGSVATYSGTVNGFAVTGVRGSVISADGTSVYLSPTVNVPLLVYGGASRAAWNDSTQKGGFRRHPAYKPADLDGDWACDKCPKVRMGGMWEEHPLVYKSVYYAATNFTTTYAEWANPFTWVPKHTRYDPHTYTMPMELKGSIVMYVFLLATARLKAAWRLGLAAGLAVFALRIGRWELGTFLGGMVLSEIDLHLGWQGRDNDDDDDISVGLTTRNGHARKKSTDRTPSSPSQAPRLRARLIRYTALFISLYLLSYPDTHAETTPGFRTLSYYTPKYYPSSLEKWRFHHALGALLFLPCALRTRFLARTILESEPAQYLGKISFAFYLVHGPVLHSVGFWIMPRLFDAFGGKGDGQVKVVGLVFGWVLLGLTSLSLADVWWRKVDLWSVGVGKRVERFMSGI